MAYRDELQALAMQVADLERDNAKLRNQLAEAESVAKKLRAEQHQTRQRGSRNCCTLCNGTLLPVAVFAGHDWRSPQPLSMSTMRFRAREGGFTHAAPVHCLACASCGYIHYFVDMADQADPANHANQAQQGADSNEPAASTGPDAA